MCRDRTPRPSTSTAPRPTPSGFSALLVPPRRRRLAADPFGGTVPRRPPSTITSAPTTPVRTVRTSSQYIPMLPPISQSDSPPSYSEIYEAAPRPPTDTDTNKERDSLDEEGLDAIVNSYFPD